MNIEPLTIARAALAWAGAGWPVIELPAGAKAPPPDGRTGAAGIDMTDAEIAAAPWRGNLGIRMRPDTLGLDVDDYGDKPGASTLAQLVATLGPLPPTWRSSNGRPGISGIRLFAVPPEMSWVAGLPGIEIVQRRHRYAVVWPSMHPEGRQYVLLDELSDEPADRIPAVDDLPELPWSWTGYLSRANDDDLSSPSTAISAEAGIAFLDEHPAGKSPGYADVIVADFAGRVSSGHSRHDSMQHALIWAMESARADIVGSMVVITALSEEWKRVMDIPRRAEIASARRVTEFDAMVRHAVGKATAKPQAAIDALADRVLGIPIAPGTPTSPPGMPSAWGLEEEHEQPAGSIWLDWSAFRARSTSSERTWIVEQFWPAGRAMALWAIAKTGKSEFALWVAAQLALGRDPMSGRWITPIDVAYFDYEMTEDDLDDRLDEFGMGDADLGRLHYALLPPLRALDGERGGSEIVAHVLEVAASVVIIDTFGRAVTGDENDADTVRAFYRHTGIRLKSAGISYLRLDHGGKDEERGQRGSSAKRDDVDIVWQIRRTKAGALLDCTGSSRVSWVPSKLAVDRIVDTDGFISYRGPLEIDARADARVIAKLEQLERLEIDPELSYAETVEQLRSRGLTAGRKSDLLAAMRGRKTAGTEGRK